MSREETFKTPLRVIKRRFYLTFWILAGPPVFWLLWPMPIGVNVGPYTQTFFTFWREVFFIWLGCWCGMRAVTIPMSIGMYFVGAFVAGGPAYEEWLAAGGHPFWDLLHVWNVDPPQVRAAIGVPPAQPFCYNCGASLAGMFGLGSNFGNICPNCGACNDTFAEGDRRPASFMGGGY